MKLRPKLIIYLVIFSPVIWLALNIIHIIVINFILPKQPSSNTPEYIAAHGIVKGQPNKIVVGDTLFHIPYDRELNVYSSGKIRKGYASRLHLYFYFPELVSEEESEFRPNFEVRAELSDRGVVKREKIDISDSAKWEKVTVKPDLGLIEIIEKKWSVGNMDYINYLTIDDIKHAGRDKLFFNCRDINLQIMWCKTAIQYPNGIHLKLFIPLELMKSWRTVYEHINANILTSMELEE